MLLPAEPGKVVSWAMLQHHSADLRARDCRGGGRRCLLGTVTAGVWMDNQELQRLARATLDADLTLAIGDVPVASTIGRLTAEDRVPAANGIRRGQLAGRQVVMSTEPLTSGVGEQARLLVSRLRASAPAARSESWARAFERMRVELGEYLTALRSSRDELARSMNRLGETLSSTHDLPKLLAASAIDTFARYGGEEFVLILPETNLEGGLAVAEKLRLATHRTPFCAHGDDGGVRLTVSIGVACFPEHATSPEELLRATDEALSEAKLQGRDRVVTAGPRLLPLAARPGQVKGRAARVE
jgi:hypothetical protein